MASKMVEPEQPASEGEEKSVLDVLGDATFTFRILPCPSCKSEDTRFGSHDGGAAHCNNCGLDWTYGPLREPSTTEEEPNDCQDCGAPHWYNFMVPDDVWKRIAPDQPCLPEEGGMLCAQCIDKRCAALGIEAEGKFYFKGEAVVSRYPDEQGERIEGWALEERIVGRSTHTFNSIDIHSSARRAILYFPEPAGGEDE